ncbi:hypothetical protein QQS45_08435 [Alteriqipengyuania flavescens]|uniref:phage nozzle protein n=1 Tax=Alteriqipengyuania flavescens TaxID=3053610 RepID=UPI0025B4312C|nr:hypothetical protein [Alteriqipengyuania flavescens]WJY17674.1 hypothetical protein QQW98_08430 [Alteriqipengyuania flavescens]WJY23617.1 hypothetical protein QQS45_08435 [Alteriqipengyuania flavescens]
MSLIQRTLPTLFNGVSRQPAILRSFDQTEDELNTWAALASGVGKRPGTRNIARLADSLPATTFVHAINRDVSERYFVLIDEGSIRVFGFDGVERTVNAPGGLGYLTGGQYAAVTVADYTFIVNRSLTVSLKDQGEDEAAPAAYLRQPSKIPYWKLPDDDFLYAGSETQYPANPPATTLTGTVARMEDLPDPPNGTYKVSGNANGEGFLNYYVRANGGVWDETVAPGLRNAIDETTMPHCLIREADGTFTFAPFSWAPRRVGDDTSNPAPTFVGRSIRDVAFYQNRLVFLVDESVVMSGAGDFGNFWRSTVLDLIASDVVDVAVTTANVAILDFITLFNDGALLFADQTQFGLSNAEDGVTPSSVAIRPVTRYPLNRKTRPVVVGTEVYFAGDTAGYSVLYEYTRQASSDNTNAAEITAHVPGLIPAGLTQLVALPRGLLALTGTGEVYCYQLYWGGDEKLMSAWRPWQFSGAARAAASVDSEVFLVVEEADGVYLETIQLADGFLPDTQDYLVHLDRQAEIAGVEADGTTTYTLPWDLAGEAKDTLALVGGNDGMQAYGSIELAEAIWSDDRTVTVPGTGYGTVTAGILWDFRVRVSEQFQVTPQGVPVTTGSLMLRQFTVNYASSMGFTATVWPYGVPPIPELTAKLPAKVSRFNGGKLGTSTSVAGKAPVGSGSFSFTVTGRAEAAVIELSDRGHGGTTFTSAEWEGFYNRRR